MDNNYLIDYETLASFVSPILAQIYPNMSASELDSLREENIKKLDDMIGESILGDMTKSQLNEFTSILEKNDDPDVICEFLDDNNINLEQKISKALETFKSEILGGKNA